MKLISAVTLALLTAVAAARAQESGEPRRGLAVARANCAPCHAVARGDRASPNPLAPPFQRVANTRGMTAMALNHFMHSAHETMPLIILSPDDQWHLVAYILSLRSR
ncbi:MAG: cytochrome c [Xanthobacteraceae bacterium]|nr:cytochrome c [Xanthobacteraceae bacterium]